MNELKHAIDALEQRITNLETKCAVATDEGELEDSQHEDEVFALVAAQLTESDVAALGDTGLAAGKWVIGRVSLSRRCWRELPLNKAYSSWSAVCKCFTSDDRNATSGDPFNCTWIKLRYNFGSRDCATTSVCTHTRNRVRHCHGATLTGTFKMPWGKELVATTSV